MCLSQAKIQNKEGTLTNQQLLHLAVALRQEMGEWESGRGERGEERLTSLYTQANIQHKEGIPTDTDRTRGDAKERRREG